jgi:RNA polymerase sigma-70 factor (ECF subfamily)
MLDLYIMHRKSLVDYAAPIVGCRTLAEDVVQEAFIRFSSSVGEERAQPGTVAQPLNYLFRIVRNLAIDWARRISSERQDPASEEVLAATAADIPSPEQAALYRDQLRVLSLALAELPARTRLAFEMHRLHNYTLQEIADRLNVSITLVHQLIRQAVMHCGRRLSGEPLEDK